MASAKYTEQLQESTAILRQVSAKFDSTSDVEMLQTLNLLSNQQLQKRQQSVDRLRDELRGATRKVELLRWEAQRPAHQSVEARDQKLDDLERVKFMLAKNIQENESLLEKYEQEVKSLEAKLCSLTDQQEVVSRPLDLELLLRLYRETFGIQPLWESGGSLPGAATPPTDEIPEQVLITGETQVSLLNTRSYEPKELSGAVWNALEL